MSCSFYLYRFRKYVSYGFPIKNFCNPGVHYETPCINSTKGTQILCLNYILLNPLSMGEIHLKWATVTPHDYHQFCTRCTTSTPPGRIWLIKTDSQPPPINAFVPTGPSLLNRSYPLLLLPLALQPTVDFGLSNNVLPFVPICHQLSPSSHSQHLKISFYFLFPSFPGSSPSSRPFQFLSEDLSGHPIFLHSL